MELREEERVQLVKLLRAGADGTISEEDFWREMDRLFEIVDDPLIGLAREEAFHYWGNFHRRNLFFISVRPDKLQVSQGKEAFRGGGDGGQRGVNPIVQGFPKVVNDITDDAPKMLCDWLFGPVGQIKAIRLSKNCS